MRTTATSSNLVGEMAMRDVDTQEQFQPLGPKVDKPAAEPKPTWKPTDQPGIERNSQDGKLRNVSPTPSDRASLAPVLSGPI
jgi:hypothetical protein